MKKNILVGLVVTGSVAVSSVVTYGVVKTIEKIKNGKYQPSDESDSDNVDDKTEEEEDDSGDVFIE